ncbi:MAG: Dps family protein [Spirochaetales bacterium]
MSTTKTRPTTARPIGLQDEGVESIVRHLNGYLSDLNVLYAKLHNFHWNVEGQAFFPLHEVLQERYEALAEEIDEVAERVLKLGHRPLTKLNDYVKNAQLEEAESRAYTSREIAEHMCSDLATLIESLRETIEVAQEHGDEGTADDAIAMLKDKEKQLWMFDAYRR